MTKVKTLIITDPTGSMSMEPEEEADEIALILEELHGLTLDWTHSTSSHVLDEVDPRLVILDYGGASIGYGDTAYSQVREVLRWAENYPSRLVLIYSLFTTWMVHEVEEEIDHIDTVLFWDPTDKYNNSLGWDKRDKHQAQVALKIRHWYGLPDPEEPDPDDYKLITPPHR